ncbi:histone deacetylase family protein [Lichenihabitans sp. Uapishka_5]|uniref:histone deacetylase family protein n=1 Tax=Lichenihabitans sp. Uapishka_5 TaxID=3037302 RepID=UPI0029E8109A|nr:histone deacetylase family protein [Lichenihabitans sp. Uapishka_5]MDX7953575.1 histone deacetylase family protein [Lichenihabitans sp. Uapishka_5]
MATTLFHHADTLLHDMGLGHPERPDRIRAILARLDGPDFAALERREAPEATRAALERVHPAAYLDMLDDLAPRDGTLVRLDGDTAMNNGTLAAARRAAGGAVAAVDAVLGGTCANAFVATRPPGHHAEPARAMGFCFLGNAVVAARHAQVAHGIGRVAIVDFDVHHGNGTQAIVWDDPSIFYGSTHEMPLFPGTGARSERGAHDTVVNAPLPPGADGTLFRSAMEEAILPRLEAFGPELVIVSAGFDAHRRDPLATLRLEAADFAWVTARLMDVAERHAGGRLVSVLEGGYDLEGLGLSVAAHVATLMGRDPGSIPAIGLSRPDRAATSS